MRVRVIQFHFDRGGIDFYPFHQHPTNEVTKFEWKAFFLFVFELFRVQCLYFARGMIPTVFVHREEKSRWG